MTGHVLLDEGETSTRTEGKEVVPAHNLTRQSRDCKVIDFDRVRINRELEALIANDPLARKVCGGRIPPVADRQGLEQFKRTLEALRPTKLPPVFLKTAARAGEAFAHNERVEQNRREPRSLGAGASNIDPVAQFRDAIYGAGLTTPPYIKTDGKIHRFATSEKKTDTAGWYVYRPEPVPHGSFGDWRQGFTETWVANFGRKLTREEREGLKAQQAKDEAEHKEIAARARRRRLHLGARKASYGRSPLPHI
jgi:hypothetical protein